MEDENWFRKEQTISNTSYTAERYLKAGVTKSSVVAVGALIRRHCPIRMILPHVPDAF